MAANPLKGWIGTFTGRGENGDGAGLLLRCNFMPALYGSALQAALEAVEPSTGRLALGVVVCIGREAAGSIRAAGITSMHGALVLEQTPDDEGVLALAGADLEGSQVSLTFVKEAPGRVLVSARWSGPRGRGALSAALVRLKPASSRPVPGPDDTAPPAA